MLHVTDIFPDRLDTGEQDFRTRHSRLSTYSKQVEFSQNCNIYKSQVEIYHLIKTNLLGKSISCHKIKPFYFS